MSLYRFDDFQLDPQSRRLLRDGCEIGVEPRVFDVVVYLIEQRERAVGRDELIAAAWGRVDSSDGTLAQAILKARRLLGDDGQAQRVIRTVARFGYQWVAAIREEPRVADAEPMRTADAAARAQANAPIAIATQPPVAAAPATAAIVDDDAFAAALPAAAVPAAIVAPPPSTAVARPPRAPRPRLPYALAAAFAVLSVLALAGVWQRRHAGTPSSARIGAVVPDLIAVLPARVHSAVAQDGWMRLGLMAMSADALRALPQHA
ncbi:MAG TPA: winged helix-turn-helix domain-containing protein, partial [Dokdonella sp.]